MLGQMCGYDGSSAPECNYYSVNGLNNHAMADFLQKRRNFGGD